MRKFYVGMFEMQANWKSKSNLNFSKFSILLSERLNILSMPKVLHQFSLEEIPITCIFTFHKNY